MFGVPGLQSQDFGVSGLCLSNPDFKYKSWRNERTLDARSMIGRVWKKEREAKAKKKGRNRKDWIRFRKAAAGSACYIDSLEMAELVLRVILYC